MVNAQTRHERRATAFVGRALQAARRGLFVVNVGETPEQQERQHSEQLDELARGVPEATSTVFREVAVAVDKTVVETLEIGRVAAPELNGQVFPIA